MSTAMASPPRAICEASLAVLSPGMLSRIVRWQKCLEPTCPYCMETCDREDNSLVRHIADVCFWTVDEELENHRPEALETASEGRGGKEDGKPECWLHGGTVAEHEGSLRENVGSFDGDTAEKKPTSSSLPEQLVVGGFVRKGSIILSQAGTVFYSFEESQDTSAVFAGTRLEEDVGKVVNADLDEGVEEDMAEVEEKGGGQFFGGGEDEILREDRDELLEDRRDGIPVDDEGEISREHRDEVAEENRVEGMVEVGSEVMDGKQDLVLGVMDEKQGAVLEEKRDVISEKKLEELSERDPDELFEEKRDEALDEKKEGIAWGASAESLDGKLEREAKTLEVEFAVSRVVEAIVNWKGKVIDNIFEDNDGVFTQFTPVDGGREQISGVTPAKASSDDVDGILLESREELDEDEFSKHSLKRRKEVDRAETAVDSNEEKPEEGHRKADEACDMDVAENDDVDVDKAFGLTHKVASPLVVTLDESSAADSSVLFDGDDDCGDRGNGDAGVVVEAERTPTPDERARVEDFRGGGDLKTNEVDDEDYVRSPPKRARLTNSAPGSPGVPGTRARVVVEQSPEEELDSRLLRMRRFLRRVADARDPLSAGLTPFPNVVGSRRRVTFAPVTDVHAVYATRRLRPVPCGRCGLIVCDGLLGLRLHVREHARNLSCVLCGVAGFESFADLRRHSCPGWSAGGDEGVSPEDVKDAEDMIIAEIVNSGTRTIRV